MLRRLVTACPVVALALACASPTLPLPPPLAPSVITSYPDADHVKLTAACNVAEVNAVIVVINNSPGVPANQAVGGALTDSCGGWNTIVYAHRGDRLDITYQLNLEISQPTTIFVP